MFRKRLEHRDRTLFSRLDSKQIRSYASNSHISKQGVGVHRPAPFLLLVQIGLNYKVLCLNFSAKIFVYLKNYTYI